MLLRVSSNFRIHPHNWAILSLITLVSVSCFVANSTLGLTGIAAVVSAIVLLTRHNDIPQSMFSVRLFCALLFIYVLYFVVRGNISIFDSLGFSFIAKIIPNIVIIPFLLLASSQWQCKYKYLISYLLPPSLFICACTAGVALWGYGISRPSIGFLNPLVLSLIVSQVSVFLVIGGVSASTKGLLWRLFGLFCALVIVALITKSRSSTLFMLFFHGFAWLAIARKRGVSMKTVIVFCGVVIAGGFCAISIFDAPHIVDRFSGALMEVTGNVGDHSSSIRLVIYEASLEAIWQKPLFGYGIIDFYEGPVSPFFDGVFEQSHAHNVFLNHLLVGGMPAILLILLIILTPLIALFYFKPVAVEIWLLGCGLTLGMFMDGMTNRLWLDEFRATILIMTISIALMYIETNGRFRR